MSETFALSGSCYWCMQAVLDSLTGIGHTRIGWFEAHDHRVEMVKAQWDKQLLPLGSLLAIHRQLFCQGGNHALRQRYPKAIYFDSAISKQQALSMLAGDDTLAVDVPATFKPATPGYQHLYLRHPHLPFCQRIIKPKILMLKEMFPQHLISHAQTE